jgi:hypothetical protein
MKPTRKTRVILPLQTAALQKCFRDPALRNVCTALYILDSREQLSKSQAVELEQLEPHALFLTGRGSGTETTAARTERLNREELTRAEDERWERVFDDMCHKDALPFFRNEFFQDPALVRLGRQSSRIIVAT